MARLMGVDIPDGKRVVISLTYIFGIGRTRSEQILKEANVGESVRVRDLTEQQLAAIRNAATKLTVEGELRRNQAMDIKRLMEIKSWRGSRHARGLPVRGQRTKTNARTRKGPRKTVANKKIETK